MKTFCGFIGWIVGMFLGFFVSDSVPILGIAFVLGGIPAGRYIGGLIEESREEEQRRQQEYANRKKQEEYERERRAQRKSEAQALAKKYPEATKKYFKQHWGITKTYISIYDITDDKVDALLSHKWSYEKDERDLNPAYKARIEAERLEKIRKEAERKEKERQALLAKKQAEEREKKSLLAKVSSWNTIDGSFHYSYLLDYFPTTCDFDASNSEWENRYLIWNFKNTPGKTSSANHSAALVNIIPRIQSKLVNTFGKECLKYLTLVCIPASTSEKTERRYKDFSRILCNKTGMENSYDKIHVISSSSEKKFGGSGISTDNLSFEPGFFNGKYVLLFDDVITKGESMLRFKIKMESLDAIVVGGLSIGKTKHSR